jgi:pyruvyl transferase EpsI
MIVSKFISFEFKVRVLLFLEKFKKNNFLEGTVHKEKQNVFVFLAADYGNLGDVAISYAQFLFLKDALPEANIIDVPISKTIEAIHYVKKHIKSKDIVTTVGGGNLGDRYDQIEFLRQLIVENFPKQKVVSFPQTIEFAKTMIGNKALRKAQKVYGRHKNLTFIAREKKSFEDFKTVFPNNNVLLTPDIVMNLSKEKVQFERKGVLYCLREDDEKLLTKEEGNSLVKIVNTFFDKNFTYDTHIGRGDLSASERNGELNKIWDAFKSSELVITDRLHGMIFCYITNTPCVVFQNNNHKVKGCYEWIKETKNIVLMDEYNENTLKKVINDFKDLSENKKINVLSKFDELKRELIK